MLYRGTALLLTVFAVLAASPAAPAARADDYYAQWENGPPSTDDYFPLAVWLQAATTSRINQYKAIGINLYIGLWDGPTESQLSALKNAGMQVICHQNATGLASPNNDVIVGWMQRDEPDNAQPDGSGGYGPPVLPSVIAQRYQDMVTADPTRPVWMNLGVGVAWDGWWGRGVRTNHPEDYPLYIMGDASASPPYGPGCDIVSFDIYPYAMNDADSRYTPNDKGWYVPFGVERLVGWSDPATQRVWNCVECTNIHGHDEATPHQVRYMVWSAIIHGSRGIVYFCHEFSPFIEAGLLADPVMSAAVGELNAQITTLAPVINGPTVTGTVTAESSNPAAPVDVLVKQHGDHLYVFAACMRDETTTATFTVSGIGLDGPAEVIDEGRSLPLSGGAFQDTFGPLDVHLYRVPLATAPRIVSWEIVADHGSVGQIVTPATDGAVEPRAGGLQALRITFDQPLGPTTVTEGNITYAAALGAGPWPAHTVALDATQAIVTMSFQDVLPPGDAYTFTVSDAVTGTGGEPVAGDRDIVLTSLPGDVTGNRAVSAADILAIRAAVGPVTPATARYDVNRSGTVDGADLLEARAADGSTSP